jgi:hypothetical protein
MQSATGMQEAELANPIHNLAFPATLRQIDRTTLREVF